MNQLPVKIDILIQKIAGEKQVSSQKLSSFLKKCPPVTSDISQHAMYEHPPEDSYERKTIYSSDRFAVHIMTWNSGDYTALHSHGHTESGLQCSFWEMLRKEFIL